MKAIFVTIAALPPDVRKGFALPRASIFSGAAPPALHLAVKNLEIQNRGRSPGSDEMCGRAEPFRTSAASRNGENLLLPSAYCSPRILGSECEEIKESSNLRSRLRVGDDSAQHGADTDEDQITNCDHHS